MRGSAWTWSPTRTLGPSRLRRRLPADTRRAWSAHPQIALGELWIWVTPVKWIPPSRHIPDPFFCSRSAIESLLSRTRHVKRNVKRWRGGMMVLRWVAAGVLEAAKGFRRVKGCQDMPALVAALRARDARLGLGESEMVA